MSRSAAPALAMATLLSAFIAKILIYAPASHAEAAVVVDAQDAELALLRSELDRLALENDALRGEVEAARQRRWWWPWR